MKLPRLLCALFLTRFWRRPGIHIVQGRINETKLLRLNKMIQYFNCVHLQGLAWIHEKNVLLAELQQKGTQKVKRATR